MEPLTQEYSFSTASIFNIRLETSTAAVRPAGKQAGPESKVFKNQTIIFLNANENENHFDLIIILLLSTDLQETFPKNHKQKEFYAAVL